MARPAGRGLLTPLTQGRKDRVEYHFMDIDPADEDGASISKPLYFSALDKDTKSSGFYVSDATGKGKSLIQQDARIGRLVKSKGTDRVLFTMGTFAQSPNLFLTNTAFSAIKPESKTNPQQTNFAWGKSELITYKSRWGKPLQGVLIYPADYTPGRSYPMVTYIYERLSDELHNYATPVEWNPYSEQALSQNGYFVLKPDIAYLPRNPGKSAVDCLEPAVAAAVAKNVGIDPKRVGLIGHSWGGYQTAFVTTVSKTFAVGVAGAPLTELTSMYNSFYWNAGLSDQQLLETGQGRLEVPFWEDPKVYFENSPVWQSSKRTAPILIAAGDADGAVDWHQAQYLYQTLRRMGKNAVLLVYSGENHNFTRRPDQLDYARRLRHFLDVYLKGAKPEAWVSDGVPYLKKDD
ncbi:alpha/beta hydrolase family protein [Fimbriimonas ginsengisoli]|uniref:alpha/beta hydrolase family protein n=1 Tax=Fimbriimonas ginsengisoli TaxID=1005039 RepID=UPI00046D76A1|nr:prolyl oligopeptidase family serine peptidase [Fimbriimonas ginsengisoli]